MATKEKTIHVAQLLTIPGALLFAWGATASRATPHAGAQATAVVVATLGYAMLLVGATLWLGIAVQPKS